MFFSEEAVIVEPRKSRLDANIEGPVLISPVDEVTKTAAALLLAHKQLRPLHPAKAYSILSKGKKISLVGPCMGAPVAAMILEKCIAQGPGPYILFGFCGSINNQVRIGDIVIPDSALSEEGVSRHYHAEKFPALASAKVVAALEKSVQAHSLKYHRGKVWTTDAIFRETRDKVKRYGAEGLLAVEMEMSALLTIGRYRGVEVGGLLVVSDELFELKWKTGFTQPAVLNNMRKAIGAALEAALSLA